jgi:hypothetical protein
MLHPEGIGEKKRRRRKPRKKKAVVAESESPANESAESGTETGVHD